jgi:hypothetical protein
MSPAVVKSRERRYQLIQTRMNVDGETEWELYAGGWKSVAQNKKTTKTDQDDALTEKKVESEDEWVLDENINVRVFASVCSVGDKYVDGSDCYPTERLAASTRLTPLEEREKESKSFSNPSPPTHQWQRTRSNDVFRVKIYTKLLMLGLLKYSSLDARGMGVEMEGRVVLILTLALLNCTALHYYSLFLRWNNYTSII